MPNFWSQTTQSIYELFNGPRTVDTEFEEKQKELKASIESMGIINQTVKNFSNQTQGLRNFCQNVYNNLTKSYSKNSVYYPFIADLAETHKKVENAYNICSETLKNIQIKNVEWDKIFNDVQNGLQKREEARKIYDHYDEKMEKLVKERNEKLQKKIDENIKDIEKFERNDGKYKRAASDFIQLSNYSYNKMQELLDIKYKMLNPLICTLVNEEKKFFDSCSSFFDKFDNASQKLFGLDKGFQKTPINYDATKYIRAAKLLQGVNIGNLPQIKKKTFSATNIQNLDENLFQKHSFSTAKGLKGLDNRLGNDFIIMTKQDQEKLNNEGELNGPKITKILKKLNRNRDSLHTLNNDTKQNNENK